MKPAHVLAVTAALALGWTAPALAETPAPTPSSTPPTCPPYRPPTLDIVAPTITSGEPGTVRIHGEQADHIGLYEKQAQDSAFRFIGSYVFTDPADTEVKVTPRTNADYYIAFGGGGPKRTAPEGCEVPYYDGATPPKRMSVATSLTLSQATRTATRTYVFAGTNRGHAGDLVNLYRLDASGHRVLTAQAKTGTNGTYRIGRTFSGVGTFTFLTASSGDAANLAGQSNAMPVQIR